MLFVIINIFLFPSGLPSSVLNGYVKPGTENQPPKKKGKETDNNLNFGNKHSMTGMVAYKVGII